MYTYNKSFLESSAQNMSTRFTKKQNVKLGSCTEFTLHVNQLSHGEKKKNLIDYSQKKLEKYIETINDPQQTMVLYALLHDYIKGCVALAWKKGQPVYIQVTKD